MESQKIAHLLYCPFTGLGLYQGFRGNRWLKNRIKIFKQFVIPSLLVQTNKNFILWVSWRYEDRSNPQVQEFKTYLDWLGSQIGGGHSSSYFSPIEPPFRTIFTYSGVCFWDDKYPVDVARTRLIDSIHGSLGEVINVIGDAEIVLMTIQPSDDCYHKNMVAGIQATFEGIKDLQAFGFTKWYVMNYKTKKLAQWNPTTIPPFFTIKFPREIFVNPTQHVDYTGPYKSHEYIANKLKFGTIKERGFIVGTHGENISTVFDHPFTGIMYTDEQRDKILGDFGLSNVPYLTMKISLRKIFMRGLPHEWQKKCRYWLGERLVNKLHEFLRS